MIWLRTLLTECGYSLPYASTLRIDNLSALSVAKNPEHHGRMKHLDLRYFWLRDQVQQGVIQLEHIPTADMPADLCTKALGRVKVDLARKQMGLFPLSD